MKVYFFVITNARQVQAGVEQPRLIERGPYSYVQHRKKVNITREGDIIRYSYTMYLCLYVSGCIGVSTFDVYNLDFSFLSV